MAIISDRTLETVTAADIPGADTAPVASVREIRRSPTQLMARMKDARVVVVLYRTGWGETPFTRIEMNAIKGRAFDTGYDFTIFIPVEKGVGLPPWLPKTQLWLLLRLLERFDALALLQLVERTRMELQQIDSVGLQPLQTALD